MRLQDLHNRATVSCGRTVSSSIIWQKINVDKWGDKWKRGKKKHLPKKNGTNSALLWAINLSPLVAFLPRQYKSSTHIPAADVSQLFERFSSSWCHRRKRITAYLPMSLCRNLQLSDVNHKKKKSNPDLLNELVTSTWRLSNDKILTHLSPNLRLTFIPSKQFKKVCFNRHLYLLT